MSAAKPPAAEVVILDKEYSVACSEEERKLLDAAVDLLNERMLELKSSGNTIGNERIAVLAALNIAYEMLTCKNEKERYTSVIDESVERMRGKVENALKVDHALLSGVGQSEQC